METRGQVSRKLSKPSRGCSRQKEMSLRREVTLKVHNLGGRGGGWGGMGKQSVQNSYRVKLPTQRYPSLGNTKESTEKTQQPDPQLIEWQVAAGDRPV